jgi:hypothetical protein
MFRFLSVIVATLLFAPLAQAQPNVKSAVEQCQAAYPAAWAAAHRGGPASDDFVILCARDLQKIDPNFGLNGKRGNPHDVSDDIIAYKGSGNAVDVLRNEPMSIIDVCSSCGTPNQSVIWLVGPGGAGDRGVWIDPFSVSPSTPPSSGGVSQPPVVQPGGSDPTLVVLQEIEKLLRAQVEAQVYTNQRLAALEELIATDPSPTTLLEIKNHIANINSDSGYFSQFIHQLVELRKAVEKKKLFW